MRTDFGQLKDGKKISLYTIENSQVICKVTDYGATLVSLIDKRTGLDVVQGFDDVEGYVNHDAHMGASIGRTANRIEKGTFSLNDHVYHLPINNNGNSLHGGDGFDRRKWLAVEEEKQVTFRLTSVDGDQGYPGNLFVSVTYRVVGRGISIKVEGTTDTTTIFAYTNHSYFNLDQSESALDEVAQIPASQYGLVDANGLTMNHFENVEGTPFDFRNPKPLGQDIDRDHPQIKNGTGYDHYYPIEGSGLREMAVVKGKKLSLTMLSDFPGFHLYTANFLDGLKGKNGATYNKRSSFCLEAEYCPNCINYKDMVEQPIVTADKPSVHEIRFTLKNAK